jgi:hypothetical protein
VDSALESEPAEHLTNSLARPSAAVIEEVARYMPFGDALEDVFSTIALGRFSRGCDEQQAV